jgi:hypothetical protein
MKKQPLKLLIAAVFSLASWVLVDRLIIDVSLWKYLMIEGVISVAHLLYEGQLKTIFREEKRA